MVPTGRDYRCAYCHIGMMDDSRTIDHVLALSRGGPDNRTNVVWCCAHCNQSKADTLLASWDIPFEARMKYRVRKLLTHGTFGSLDDIWDDLIKCGFPCGRLRFDELIRRMEFNGEFGAGGFDG